ncbi:MAG TPA: LacI family DNA-binding transcriptional regulator [Blastocatellia bacterium]
MDKKSARITDIAHALGISIGTVDRALHNRRGVNPLTKARVLQMAKTMGYRPNAAARLLSSRRVMRISVNLPAQIASFWDAVRDGIEDEARLFASSGIEVDVRTFPRLGCGESEAFEEALGSDVQGIIMATGRPQDMKLPILKASRSSVPVVTVSNDAPGTARLASVSIDALASGSLAGELLGRLIQGKGALAVITGDVGIADHADKYHSFRDAVQSLFPAIKVFEPVLNHEDEREAYDQGRRLLRDHPDLNGLYISTANSLPVLQGLEDDNHLKNLTIITTDLFPQLIRHIESGNVVATLYQRPRAQGQLALRMLHDFLVEGTCPSHQVRFAPHFIMKSNLSFFLRRLSMEAEEEDRNGLNTP